MTGAARVPARPVRAGIIGPVESLLDPLLPLFDRERAAGRAVALGVLIDTAGSTYRKPGALILIAQNGDYAGLLSGGCLEGDLGEHARGVIQNGEPRLVSYDTRGSDDLIWGLGLGCEGALRILLLRVGPEEHWEPVRHFAQSSSEYRPTAVGIVVHSQVPELPLGTLMIPPLTLQGPRGQALPAAVIDPVMGARAALEEARRSGRMARYEVDGERWQLCALPLTLPPRLLVLGAGPDAAPVVELAARMNWKVTVADHRPAYADASHFPAAERVLLTPPDELLKAIAADSFAAAVIMSHHLPSDLKYLQQLSRTGIAYIGLLGPAVRRDRLLADLGEDASLVRQRLHAPVGLPIGGRSPESIALAIVAEIHSWLHGAAGCS